MMTYADDLTDREVRQGFLTVEEERSTRLPLEQASVLPLRVYGNRAFFEREADQVLRRSWHALARLDQLKESGSFVTGEIAGEPVIVVRDKNGAIRALSNVCRHRGAQLAVDCGVAKALVCPYHSWTYSLDGTLRGAPHMGKVDAFDRREIHLPAFRTELWNGFVFVNLDPDAEPLAPDIGRLTETLAPLDLEKWVSVPWREFTVDWNWKISMENFTEAYHHVGVHQHSIGKTSKAEDAIYEQTNGKYSLFYVHIGEDPDAAEDYPFHHVKGLPDIFRAYSPVANIYPTFHMVLGSFFGLWLRFEIDGPKGHRMYWRWLLPPGSDTLPDLEARIAVLDSFMWPIVKEDVEFMPRVRAVVESRAFAPGRYSDQERSVHQFHTWLLDRLARFDPAAA